jgi:hypothetical protein
MTNRRFEAVDGLSTNNSVVVSNTLTVSSNTIIDTNVFFVNTATDRVGIMKAPTQGRLDVNGDIYATNYFGDGSNLTGVTPVLTNVLFSDANNTYTNGRLTLSSNSSIVLSSNSLMRFEDNRVLNFGTSSSVSLLGNTSGLFVTGSNVNFDVATLFIDTGNNRVGVGTTSPQAALDVVGKIRISTQATDLTDAVRADRGLTAGDGLSGGGNLTADRSFAVDATVIRTTGNQTLGDTKTFTNAILMNGTSTNANAAVRSDRLISTGDGLSGGGNLTANRTLTVDTTVIRTTGNQTLGGLKTFSANVQINANLTVTGDINNSSDIRLKTNVATIEDALNKVCNLRGVSYEKDGKESIGLIAQEVINIVPQVVNTDQEYMSVSYHNLIALLIEAVKELNDKIDNKA